MLLTFTKEYLSILKQKEWSRMVENSMPEFPVLQKQGRWECLEPRALPGAGWPGAFTQRMWDLGMD